MVVCAIWMGGLVGRGTNAAFPRGQGRRRLSSRGGTDVARCADAHRRLRPAAEPWAFRRLARTRRRPLPVHGANDDHAHAAVAFVRYVEPNPVRANLVWRADWVANTARILGVESTLRARGMPRQKGSASLVGPGRPSAPIAPNLGACHRFASAGRATSGTQIQSPQAVPPGRQEVWPDTTGSCG